MLDSCFRFSEEKKRHYYSEVCKLQILSPRVPKLASVTESQFFKACEALFCVLMEKKKKDFWNLILLFDIRKCIGASSEIFFHNT